MSLKSKLNLSKEMGAFYYLPKIFVKRIQFSEMGNILVFETSYVISY
jgi:hypothetical protein